MQIIEYLGFFLAFTMGAIPVGAGAAGSCAAAAGIGAAASGGAGCGPKDGRGAGGCGGVAGMAWGQPRVNMWVEPRHAGCSRSKPKTVLIWRIKPWRCHHQMR